MIVCEYAVLAEDIISITHSPCDLADACAGCHFWELIDHGRSQGGGSGREIREGTFVILRVCADDPVEAVIFCVKFIKAQLVRNIKHHQDETRHACRQSCDVNEGIPLVSFKDSEGNF